MDPDGMLEFDNRGFCLAKKGAVRKKNIKVRKKAMKYATLIAAGRFTGFGTPIGDIAVPSGRDNVKKRGGY